MRRVSVAAVECTVVRVGGGAGRATGRGWSDRAAGAGGSDRAAGAGGPGRAAGCGWSGRAAGAVLSLAMMLSASHRGLHWRSPEEDRGCGRPSPPVCCCDQHPWAQGDPATTRGLCRDQDPYGMPSFRRKRMVSAESMTRAFCAPVGPGQAGPCRIGPSRIGPGRAASGRAEPARRCCAAAARNARRRAPRYPGWASTMIRISVMSSIA